MDTVYTIYSLVANFIVIAESSAIYFIIIAILINIKKSQYIVLVEVFFVVGLMRLIIERYDSLFLNSFYYESKNYLVVVEYLIALALIKIFFETIIKRIK